MGMTLALFVSGITCYRWLRLQLPVPDAERGALLYAGFPYVLLLIYYSFGHTHLWAIALFPFLLEAAHEMTQKDWHAIPKLSIAYALLCLTHLPSLIVFGAVPCLYVIVFTPRERRISAAILAVLAGVLGTGLAAVYLLPLIQNRPYLTSDHFITGKFFYANNFLDMQSFEGLFLVIVPLIILCSELPSKIRRQQIAKPVLFWVVVLAVYVFMVLPLSKPLWNILPPLQNLQFPFRFFTGMLPGVVFIAACWLPHVKSQSFYKMLFLATMVWCVVVSSAMVFTREISPAVAPILASDFTPLAASVQTHWMADEGVDEPMHMPKQYLAMKPAEFAEGKGRVSITSRGPRIIMLHAEVDSPEAIITLRHFYFPGWLAEPEGLKVEPHKGLLSLRLPHGSHDVTLRVPWFAGEREGTIVSLCTILLLGGLIVAARLRKRPSPDSIL
jgi:hypothetical protein